MTEIRERHLLILCLMALAIGIGGGVGAWLFRSLIGFLHNMLFLGDFAVAFDANIHTALSPWGPYGIGIIAVPVLGAIGVTWLVTTFAPEAKGHGVPEVMDAIYYQDGRIRPKVVLVKALASGLSIGSGGSVGREGPIIQIGAAFGSTLGQWVPMPARQRVVLMAAGAAAGIAATFNAPLGGVLFALELLLVAVNARTLLLVTISTVTATFVGELLLGAAPAFAVPALTLPSIAIPTVTALLLFIPLGLLCGLAAALFIKAIYWAEDFFDNAIANPYLRHCTGMLGVGIIIWLLIHYAGHYYVEGVGYASILDVLTAILRDPWFMLALFVLKLTATCLTLGSGASGGIFSPALFMGAMLGGAFGHGAMVLFPDAGLDPAMFAIAGMAAIVGASTGALLTGTVMIMELTGDYAVAVPVLVCAAIAGGVRKRVLDVNIYTLKLLRRGQVVPEGLTAAVLDAHQAASVMTRDFALVDAAVPGDTKLGIQVTDEKVTGVITPDGPAAHVVLPETATMAQVLQALHDSEADVAILSSDPASGHGKHVVGLVTQSEIAQVAKRNAALI